MTLLIFELSRGVSIFGHPPLPSRDCEPAHLHLPACPPPENRCMLQAAGPRSTAARGRRWADAQDAAGRLFVFEFSQRSFFFGGNIFGRPISPARACAPARPSLSARSRAPSRLFVVFTLFQAAGIRSTAASACPPPAQAAAAKKKPNSAGANAVGALLFPAAAELGNVTGVFRHHHHIAVWEIRECMTERRRTGLLWARHS